MVAARSKAPADPFVDWYEDAEEVPNPSAPDGRRLARRQVWTRRYVKFSVILCPVLLFAALAAITRTQPHTPKTSLGSPGRTAATIAIDRWLAEQPSPLPGASILSYDGTTLVTLPKGHKGSLPFRAVIENFTLVSRSKSSDPGIWPVGVEVALDHHGGAAALTGPSFLPTVPTSNGSWDQGGPWPGYTATSSVSGAVQTVVNNWLAAYTSGDNAELHLAVGDPNPKHTYVALSGVTSAGDTVLYAAPIGTSKQDEMIVQVALNLLWRHEHRSTPLLTTSSQPAVQTTMDLLIAHASSAAPVVVAWGPPGSGPSLHPYENAVG